MCETACKQERYFIEAGLVCLETKISDILLLPEQEKQNLVFKGKSQLSRHFPLIMGASKILFTAEQPT